MYSSDLSLCLLENAYGIKVSRKGGRVLEKRQSVLPEENSAACEKLNQ